MLKHVDSLACITSVVLSLINQLRDCLARSEAYPSPHTSTYLRHGLWPVKVHVHTHCSECSLDEDEAIPVCKSIKNCIGDFRPGLISRRLNLLRVKDLVNLTKAFAKSALAHTGS